MQQASKIKAFLVGLLLAVSLGLRIPGIFESLWFDEVFRTFVVMRGQGIKDLLLHDVHNPLYNALMYVWIRVFGDSEVCIRIPSLMAGYALVWLIWRWTRPRLGARAAWIAAVWLLISPVPVWYSTEAKNSIFTVLTSAWVLVSHSELLSAGARHARRRVVVCTIACVLAVLTDFQTLLIIVPVWAGVGIEAWRRGRDAGHDAPGLQPRLGWSLGIIALATAVLLLPLVVLKATNVSELPRDYPDLFHLKAMLWFLCLWMPIGTVLPNAPPGWWPLEVASTGVILLPLMGLGLRRLWGIGAGRLVVLSFVFPLAFFLIASALLHALGDRTRIYQDRNIIVLIAWYPVVLAAGIDSIGRRLVRDAAVGVVLGGALIASVLIDTVLDESWTVMTPNPDWRAAGRIVDAAPGRALVLSRTALLPLRYYCKDSELIEFDRTAPAAPEIARALAGRGESEFFLITDPWWSGLRPEELPAIDSAFPLLEQIKLRSLLVERRRRGR
jgi:uncharacterized membrane protein